MKRTKAQQSAIDSRNQDLLISAAAGSGKTSVLIERITKLILTEHVPVSRMLVVTFTKAAAGEMRERLRNSLTEELKTASGEERAFLRAQLRDLPTANISTFHSFATEILRQYFPLCGVDPAFRVADETEATLLQQEAMDLLFEQNFERTGPEKEAFLDYLSRYAKSRSEDLVKEQIREVSRYSESMPKPEEWLDRCASYPDQTFEEWKASPAFRSMLSDIMLRIQKAKEMCRFVTDFVSLQFPNELGEFAEKDMELLDEIEQAFRNDYETGRNLVLAKLSLGKPWATFSFKGTELDGKQNEEKRDAYKKNYEAQHNGYKAILKELAESCCKNPPEDAYKKVQETADSVRTLVRLVKEYRALYAGCKAERKALDFSDLEHYAIAVLDDETAVGTLRSRFQYIFVDEYQDSNAVQEYLIERLKSPDNTLFFVGDVKQSIYRFRLAEPKIFQRRMARYREASKDDPDAPERLIAFNENFRSDAPILAATNALFEKLIEPVISGMVYDDDAALHPGREEQKSAKTPVELHLLHQAIDEEESEYAGSDEAADDSDSIRDEIKELGKIEAEALLAAELVEQNLTDGRKPEDIVILLREKAKMPAYEDALLAKGIPAFSEAGEGFFDTLETSVLMNFLRILDNFHQDEPLLSVLHSFLFRFSADELAEIRIQSPSHQRTPVTYADAFLRYAGRDADENAEKQEAGSAPDGICEDAIAGAGTNILCVDQDLREKCKEVLQVVDACRRDAAFLPLDSFLWALMNETGYYNTVGALPGGTVRQANLRALVEKAAAYEAGGGKGLGGWIRYVDAMRRGQLKVPQIKSSGSSGAVRIMTIHASKGLEFPVVLLGNLNDRMRAGHEASVQMHADGILAIPWKSRELCAKDTTILQTVLKRENEREELAEKMRVLYVAMTRASHKLILLGSPGEKTWNAYRNGTPIPNGGILTAKSYLDWILGSEPLRKQLQITLHEKTELVLSEQEKAERKSEFRKHLQEGFGVPKTELSEELSRRYAWRYPFAAETVKQSKWSVTDLNRMMEGKTAYEAPLAVPAFARSDAKHVFTAAEKGTLIHKVMELIPFRDDWTKEGIRSFIRELCEKQFFTEEEAAALSPEPIWNFFRSDIGKRAISAYEAGNLFRETDFNHIRMLDGSEILLQGTIDCYFSETSRNAAGEEETHWILIDYKSNYLTNTEERENDILETYREQLLLYRDALEEIRGITVSEIYLYAFSINKALPFAGKIKE